MKQTLLCFRHSGMGFHISRQRWHSIRFKGFSLLALNRDLSECILFLNINFRSTCTNIIISLFERIEERNFLPMHLPFHATRSTSFIDLFDRDFRGNVSFEWINRRVHGSCVLSRGCFYWPIPTKELSGGECSSQLDKLPSCLVSSQLRQSNYFHPNDALYCSIKSDEEWGKSMLVRQK